VTFNVADPAFKLDDLLTLQLHKFEEDVGEIVDRAQKEEKMENGLNKLEENWAKMVFQFHQHKTTDVYTVKMAEEDFEVRGITCWQACCYML
jgi:dynein heavy chain